MATTRGPAAFEGGRLDVTARLARFVAETRYEDLPSEVVASAKKSFLDTVGVCIGGSAEPGPRLLVRFVKDSGGNPAASVVGHGFRTSPQHAAWVNGTSADVNGWADFSVSHMSHPSVSVCPAVWALGESRRAPGREVLAAYILGVEVTNKIAAGVKPHFHRKGWHAIGVCGTFGAAAAAGKLLGLDAARMASALGIAGAEASGIKVSMTTMAKPYAAGRSARDGIGAAVLAGMGFTGPADVFEGRDGFLQTFGDGASGERILEHLGDPYEFVWPGLTFKAYPSCTHTHTAIEATLDLKRRHGIVPSDVAAVQCSVSPVVADFLAWTSPRDRIEARFSMQFCVASALVEGKVDAGNFTDEKVRSPEVVELMRKVRMDVSPELARLGYNPDVAPSGCTVTITLKDGRRYTKPVNRGPWEPPNAPSWDDLAAKYRRCAGPVLPDARIAESIDLLARLEQLDDISRLMDVIRG